MKVTKDPLTRDYARALRRIQVRKAALNRRLRELTVEEDQAEDQLRKHIVETLKLESVRVGGYNFTPSFRDIAELYDPNEFFRYVAKTKSFDLLHRRVTMEAIRERWNDGVKVPGVRPGKVPTLSVSKAGETKGAK